MQTSTRRTDGRTSPLWMEQVEPINYPALHDDASTDVCVVGGGIAGLTTAYLLLTAGRKVTVLDDSPIGDGQTGRTSAHLASAVDDRFMNIEETFDANA